MSGFIDFIEFFLIQIGGLWIEGVVQYVALIAKPSETGLGCLTCLQLDRDHCVKCTAISDN